MRYGLHTSITAADDGTIVQAEEKFFDFKTIVRIDRYSQSIRVKDDQEALAHFLSLMDKHKAGEVADYGVQCFSDRDGQVSRIEKTWAIWNNE